MHSCEINYTKRVIFYTIILRIELLHEIKSGYAYRIQCPTINVQNPRHRILFVLFLLKLLGPIFILIYG